MKNVKPEIIATSAASMTAGTHGAGTASDERSSIHAVPITIVTYAPARMVSGSSAGPVTRPNSSDMSTSVPNAR